MTELNRKKPKISTSLTVIIVFIGIIFFLLRGPYLSNSIKRVIIPVLENATQERVLIDKAVINLFPFYIQAKGFKVFDREGNRLLWITKTRVYIDLLGLLSRQIRIRKITLMEPDITMSAVDVKRIQDNLGQARSGEDNGDYRIQVKNIKVTDGSFVLKDIQKFSSLSGKGIFAEVSSGTRVGVRLSVSEGSLEPSGLDEIDYSIEGSIRIHEESIDIIGLHIISGHSFAELEGELKRSPDNRIGDGHIEGKAKIYVATLDKLFGFKQEKEGYFAYDGSVHLMSRKDAKWPAFDLDLETESQFYLETLMEMVKGRENISGKVSLDGTIKGRLPEIEGKGKLMLEKAMFSTLPVEDLQGNVFYKDHTFSLKDFSGHLLQGEMHGEAHITIPQGDFSVDGTLKDVNSKDFFRFITWEDPFPRGVISGNVALNHDKGHGMEFMADIDYVNHHKADGDVLDRLQSIHTDLKLKEGILTLENTLLSTAATDLFMEGNINLEQDTFDLALHVEATDALDVTAPYYEGMSAPVSFKGTLTGTGSDPSIRGRIEAGSGRVHNIEFSDAYADIVYRIKKLAVSRLMIKDEDAVVDASGSIDFRKSDRLFSFKDPFFSSEASLKSVKIDPIISASFGNLPVSGRADGNLSFKGDLHKFSAEGDLIFKENMVYGEHLERISLKTSIYPDRIEFENMEALKGTSTLIAQGRLFFNREFVFNASSRNVYLDDFTITSGYPIGARIVADIAGKGNIDNPDITFDIDIIESSFKGAAAGKGEMKGKLVGRKLIAEGSLADGIMRFHADALLSGESIWDVEIDFHRGRYDFLLAGFMTDMPRDLSVSLAGRTRLKAEGGNISVFSDFSTMEMSLYGYSFKNKGDILLDMTDDQLNIRSFTLSGDNASLFADGFVKLKDRYGIKLRGNLDISPLRSMSSAFSSAKGAGNFSVDINGEWNNPEVTGEVNVDNAIVKLANVPYRIGPVNGSFYFDRDRISFDSVESGFGGGKIILSGAGFIDNFRITRLYVSSDVSDIRIKPFDNVVALFDGKLFYETSPEGSSLAGDLDIERAFYTKNVEFANLLLGIKEVNVSTTEYPEFFRDTELNVHISGFENIVIDNNIAKTNVKIDVNVTGTPEQYGLIGRVEPDQGHIYFRGNEFNILQGTVVEFIELNSVQPVFHILAETYKSNYYVKLTLDGTMEEFNLTLFSDPPLPEMDILALLTLGRLQTKEGGIESGMGAGEAATVLAGGLQEMMQEEFHDVTGIERFQIEPHTTRTGAFSPKVTVGKRLLEDKLFVIYSTPVGTTEENVIKLKYILNKNISVEGYRNEIGSSGADLKYRFEFK